MIKYRRFGIVKFIFNTNPQNEAYFLYRILNNRTQTDNA